MREKTQHHPVREKTLPVMTAWLRARLPLDGLGFGPSAASAGLVRWGRARLRARLRHRGRSGRLAALLLPVLSPPLWAVAVPGLVLVFLHRNGLPLWQAARLCLDCWGSGAAPLEAWLWRRLFPQQPRHPLPGRAAALVQPHLGDAADHRLLADKLAFADRMAAAGLPVPPTLAVLTATAGPENPAEAPDGALPPVLRDPTPARLFVKPRHGSAGRGAVPLDRLGPGLVRLHRHPPAAAATLWAFCAHLRDDLLIQPRLTAAPDLAALYPPAAPDPAAPDPAAPAPAARPAGLPPLPPLPPLPVLRLTTARLPGHPATLHAALLCLPVPGQPPRDFLRGHLYVPVDLATATLGPGLRLQDPTRWLDHPPWSPPTAPAARLSGRPLPHLAPACALALQAMALLPGLPLVHWDIALTADGPVILEGNSCGNWILAALPPPGADALLPLLRHWAPGQA